MDPFILVMVPGFVAGLVIAFVLLKWQQHDRTGASDRVFTREPVSTDVINMSRIRVSGVGGLGLVAMAVAVAWNVPRIGQSLSAGMILGTVTAALLILWRRRTGPLPSSGAHSGANTTLAIDDVPERKSR